MNVSAVIVCCRVRIASVAAGGRSFAAHSNSGGRLNFAVAGKLILGMTAIDPPADNLLPRATAHRLGYKRPAWQRQCIGAAVIMPRLCRLPPDGGRGGASQAAW